MATKMSHTSYQHDHHHYHDRDHSHHQLAVKQEAQTFTTTTTTATSKEHNHNVNGRMSHSHPLFKFNRDSYVIKKSPTKSRLGSPPASNKSQHHLQQERGPVIIYTHSPKIIHTNARDFRALVQKLTGMSKAKEASASSMARDAESRDGIGALVVSNEGSHLGQCHLLDYKMGKCYGASNKDNGTDEESSSVIADENSSSDSTTTVDAIGQVNPHGGPPLFDAPPEPPNLPFFVDSSSELLYCSGGDSSIYEYMDFNVSCNHIN